MAKDVKGWWVSELSKQGIPSDTDEIGDRIATWVVTKNNKKNLYDILYKEEIDRLEREQTQAEVTLNKTYKSKKKDIENRYNDELKKVKSGGSDEAKLMDARSKELTAADTELRKTMSAMEKDYEKQKNSVDIWPYVTAYIKCLSPDAVVDPVHFDNRCPGCGIKHTFHSPDGLVEYNQICDNCAYITRAKYICLCPLCNSGSSWPASQSMGIRTKCKKCGEQLKMEETPIGVHIEFKCSCGFENPSQIDPIYELLPVLDGVYQDMDKGHYPPYTPPNAPAEYVEDYKKLNPPESRYTFTCPICLYRWAAVWWIPSNLGGAKDICPVCGSPMKPTGGKGPSGNEELECTNPACNEGPGHIVFGGERGGK